MQLKAYKFRLYPTKEQEQTLAQFFGAKRWIFNHYLHENKQRFLNKEKNLTHYDINKLITTLKKQPETSWLKDIDDWCLKNASEDLHNAYQTFFNSITGVRKGPKISAPKFKNKNSKQSYRTRGAKVLDENTIFLPKLKKIKAVIHRPIIGNIKSATVSKTPSGQYYISLLVEQEINLLPSTGKEIGIDLGIKDLAILSNGLKFQSPIALLEKINQQLKKEQRKLARKQKGSKNRAKQRLKVAKLHQRIVNARNAYYHLISNYLVSNFDAIYMESLNVKGMLQNRCLSRVIHESSWSTLVSMISYKAGFYGKTFHQIGRFVPSSKTCSCCGHKLDNLKLSQREWTCPSCGVNHDRDLNAAQNILQFGQQDVYDQIITSRATMEGESSIPTALVKYTSKIEKSSASPASSCRDRASLTVLSSESYAF